MIIKIINCRNLHEQHIEIFHVLLLCNTQVKWLIRHNHKQHMELPHPNYSKDNQVS